MGLALLITFWFYLSFYRWAENQPIPPLGGDFFRPKVLLPVPYFFQGDERWGDQLLAGQPEETMANFGCAVTSASMVLNYYGADSDPGMLNEFLMYHDGFTDLGWLKWEQAALLSPCGSVRLAYEGLPKYRLIDENLRRQNPVIIRVRLKNGLSHFLVIIGKEGMDYIIQDPSHRGLKGPYPLRNFGSNIEALRYYDPPVQP